MTEALQLPDAMLNRAFMPAEPADDRRFLLPPPIDKTWLRGVAAESEAAQLMARVICPDMWGGK